MNTSRQHLHVSFTWSTPLTLAKLEELEPVFSSVGDWLRYAENCWIVRTDVDSNTLTRKLQKHMKSRDAVLIVPIDPNQIWGLQEKWIWDWFLES